jgi:ArsR family transcriptional regulator
MSMMTDMDAAVSAFPTLKALADPLRWRIVQALAQQELCVCHLTEDLGAPQPLISHHLRILRKAELVESERFRYWTYYRLTPNALTELSAAIDALAHAAPASARQRRPCC